MLFGWEHVNKYWTVQKTEIKLQEYTVVVQIIDNFSHAIWNKWSKTDVQITQACGIICANLF